MPTRLYPPILESRIVAIDPNIAFGRPVVLRIGVATRAVVDRICAGETAAELMKDYGLTRTEIRQARRFERSDFRKA